MKNDTLNEKWKEVKRMKNKKEENEEIIRESVDESMKNPVQENISDEHSMTVATPAQDKALAPQNGFRGVDIAGMESVPMSLVAVPFVRLIQPTSKKTEDVKGNETPAGNFLFNDTQKAYGEIDFALLRAKVGNVTFKRDDGDVTVQRLTILGCTQPENKLFVLTLSPTSFSTFGRLIAQFKDAKIKQSWRFLLTMSSEKKENDKGKFYVAKFVIGEELGKEDVEELARKSAEYGVVLDRQDIAEEDYLGK